jgi:hypothetical protein
METVFSVTLIGNVSHQFRRVLDLMSDTGRILFPGDLNLSSTGPFEKFMKSEVIPQQAVRPEMSGFDHRTFSERLELCLS